MRYIAATKSYKLALNNGFFCLKAPEMEKHAWNGNIYAFEKKETKTSIVNANDHKLIYIYGIPKTWLKDEEQEYGVFYDARNSDVKTTPVLYTKNGKINVTTTTALITENDFVRCMIGQKPYICQLSGQKQNLLEKNMLINGTPRFFYPMGASLYWVKDFAEYEAGNANLEGNKDVHITLDRDLTADIYKILKDKLSAQASVVALDGNGNIRLLVDNNKHLNPNDLSELEEYVTNSYLNPNYETDSRIFGNLNLIHMQPGPGSSMKPITYAAVTSQIDENKVKWSSLQMKKPELCGVEKKIIEINGKKKERYVADKFGLYRYPASAPFISIPDDEKGKDNWINNDFYLYKSSNYYNALITYLGYYNKDAFNNVMDLLRPAHVGDFPIVKFGSDQEYAFKSSPDKERTSCALNDGLHDNFGLSVASDAKQFNTDFITDKYKNPNAKEYNHPWLFPQLSSNYLFDSYNLNEEIRLKQYALGSNPLKMTPLMMAEMYGRLYSMHPDYQATVIENKSDFSKKWSRDMFEFYRDNIFVPMGHCAAYGTASYLGHNKKGYCLYAKTGTLLGDGNKLDDRMLAVIITNKDLANATSTNDYRDVL